jgi:hypothetical protein
MNAYGAALSGTVPVVVDFNLSEGQGQAARAGKAKQEVKPFQKIAVLAASITLSLSCLIGTFLWTGKMVDQATDKKKVTIAKLGTFADMDITEITNKSETIKTKFSAIRSLRFKGGTTPLVVNLVKLLPPGIWLQNVLVEFEDVPEKPMRTSSRAAGFDSSGAARKAKVEYYKLKTRSRLTISGYCYLNNANEEFNVVNQYVTKLKSTEEIAAQYRDINLLSMRTEDLENHQVVSFVIKCE